jgi:hypothetical protein
MCLYVLVIYRIAIYTNGVEGAASTLEQESRRLGRKLSYFREQARKYLLGLRITGFDPERQALATSSTRNPGN